MSKYTIELGKVIEFEGRDNVKSWFMDYELTDYLTPDEIAIIEQRGTWSKDKLADLILDHYCMHEIGLETVGLFAHQAKVLMKELMEEKLPLIYSASIKYDPMINVDFVEEYESENTSESKSDGLSVQSDTPQGQINKEAILNGDYASNTGATEGTNDSKGTQKYKRTQKGNSGSLTTAQALVRDYRKNIIMINRDIIDDLSSLFMQIY